ncbi:hypothetical protein INT47_009024 [Mucor saturninus]|uniref:Uncharacterized protein n=1 Tax=Mucor saturninus TaxID=64648 RepID=A0A8H7QGM6_9FUNG|nr:hypothetical protein INT47_009024 [Mucor saturninus]
MYRSQLTGNSDLSISDMSYLLSLENSTGENDLSVITDRQDDQDFSIPALLSNVSQQSDDLVLIQSRYLKGDESSLYKKKNLELLSSVHYFPTPGVLIPSRRKDTSYVHLYGHSIKIKDSSNKTFYMCNFGGSHGCHKHYESKDSNTSAIRRHLEDVHGFTKTTAALTQASTTSSIVSFLSPIQKPVDRFIFQEKLINFIIHQRLPFNVSISFSTDMWTSSSGQDYMGLVAHYINANWEHKSVVIGLEAPSEAHTGEHLAALFLRVLDDYDIRSKLAFIVSFGSTATANTEMRHAAEENERQVDSQSGISGEYERMEVDDDGDAEVDEDPNDSGVNYDKDPISKMRRGIFTIRYLNVINLSYKHQFTRIHKGERYLVLKYDTRTRWNSTFEMIDRWLEVEKAYNSTCLSNSSKLGKYALNDQDVAYLKSVSNFLAVFLHATLRLSSEKVTTISDSILIYNALMEHMETFLRNLDDPDNQLYQNNTILQMNKDKLRFGIKNVHKKLEKYYTKTDDSNVYSIATAMDPRYKYQYYRDNDWQEGGYLEQAVNMVTDEWAENYKFEAYITIPPPAQNMNDDENFVFLVGDPLLTRNASSSALIDDSIRSRQKRKFEEVADVFENLVSGSSQKKLTSQYNADIYEDDLSRYLAKPVRVRNRGEQMSQ